jgi:hypothetical protein
MFDEQNHADQQQGLRLQFTIHRFPFTVYRLTTVPLQSSLFSTPLPLHDLQAVQRAPVKT